jgi:putative membrane fusion protein
MNEKRKLKRSWKLREITPHMLLVVALCGLFGFYVVMQAASAISNKVETTRAVAVTENDSFQADGCFIRDESLIPAVGGEAVEYLVKDGSRVKKGETLAVEYNSTKALERNSQIAELTDEKDILQSVRDNLENLSDQEKMDQLIKMQILNLQDHVRTSNVSGVGTEAKELKELVLKRSLTQDDKNLVDKKIQSLEKEISSLQEKTGTASNTITSPYSGYFSEVVDGYEGILKAKDIEDLTPSSLCRLLEKSPEITSDSMGKIMDNFSWYFAAFVSQDDMEKFKIQEDSEFSLRFSQVSEDVDVKVIRVAPDESGKESLVIMQGNTVSSELLSMRQQNVEVIRNTYTGIKIPKDAVRMVDGKLGVYILSGSLSNFKTIETVYEGSNFYLIKQGNSSDTGVVVGDNIVVKSKDLEDKKVIK